ncbi:MAG: exosortase-dependent surface protein XDP2 [Nostocales cyanobacterium 94392]|nr:exosortase-dependent surface protein XDP2 [Nostocales cyanobacterium 94392]
MKFNKLITSLGLTFGTVLFVSNSAQAASFTTNVTQNNGPQGDVLLESIEQNGRSITQFSFVERVDIIHNDAKIAGKKNSGAASTDRGRLTTLDLNANEDPTGNEIVQFLRNDNLNYIIDTEDQGSFKINLFFDNAITADNTGLDSLFFWERGMNSDLLVQAIDDEGNIIGNAIKLLRKEQEEAGFQISTLEIGNNIQNVGSWGVSLEQLGVTNLSGIQIYADNKFNGPDFKVIARKSQGDFAQASVPEPGTIIGLGTVAALAFFRRRKSM